MRPSLHPQKGSLILVVLCLLAVLGIGLAAFLGVGNQSMKLSNRSIQTGLSAQLAELGLSEALRSLAKNDWSGWTTSGSSATWTISGTTATCNLTFPATKFGQGVTGSVKIRIDNYNAAQLNSTWSSSANYRINDLVGYNGTWYRCVQNHSNQTPGNLDYWVSAPISWTWSSNLAYAQYSVVNYNGTWYRCHTAAASGILPTNTSYWAYISKISLSWSSGTTYPLSTMLFDSGIWYYCILAHTSSASITPTNTAYWAPVITATGTAAVPGVASGYFLSAPYSSFAVGDYIYRVSTPGWYRSLLAQTYVSGDYANAGKWTVGSLPYISWAWRSGVSYAFNDIVFYSASGSGAWYRCITPGATTPTSSSWENALSGTMRAWSSGSIRYNLGDVVYYATTGNWYRCTLAHTSTSSTTPDSTTYPYWSNAPLFNTIWDSNKQYSQNDTVRYNGVWYLSLQNSNYGQNPSTASSAYWIGANTSTASYQWNATTAYAVGNYKCYGGVWNKCLVANTGQSPNNTTYWTSAWAQSSGVTTGAPVVYAEGTVTFTDSPAIKTQLRATIGPAPLFPNAAAANTTISANSGGTVDSYDGSVYSMSTAGTYSVYTYNQSTSPFSGGSPNLGYSAVLAAGSTSGTAITLSSTAVKGYLAAPSSSSTPYAPLYSSGGSVKGPSSPGSPNIDLTRISRSPYIPQFDTLPAGGLAANWAGVPKGLDLSTGLAATTNIGTPGATVPARYYINGNLTLSSSSGYSILNINGPVILFINGDLTMDSGSPNGKININNTGSAEIHIAGKLTVNIGADGINNITQDPKNLIVICDATSSSAQNYSDGSSAFYGTIYVPNTTNSNGLLFDSSGSVQIYGAISANKITYSGINMNIHYDTSLRYAVFSGVDQPYAITEWRELKDPSEQATMP